MRGLLASEVFRLRKRTMPYVLLGLLVAIVALLYLLLWLIVRVEEEEGTGDTGDLEDMIALADVLGNGMDLAYSVAGVMAIILAASIISTEFGWGTIRTILPRSSGRNAFIGAKVIVVGAFIFLVALTGLLTAIAASAAVTSLGDLNSDLPGNFAFEAVATLARATIAMLPYASFAFMIALLTRSGAAGIGVGLAYYFLEDTLALLFETAGSTGETISELLITSNVSSLMIVNHADTSGDYFNPWRAAATLIVYSAIFLGVAFWRFRTRDVQVG